MIAGSQSMWFVTSIRNRSVPSSRTVALQPLAGSGDITTNKNITQHVKMVDGEGDKIGVHARLCCFSSLGFGWVHKLLECLPAKVRRIQLESSHFGSHDDVTSKSSSFSEGSSTI